ncbi:hypothetical protein Aduo_001090 [Ancylostoma duodenale]
MERLVEECELDCPEEKQIQILEKCLPLLRTDREAKVRSIGFVLLTRILEKCSAQCLRAAQSRLGKKLVDVKNDPTIYGGIFLRQLLVRNPQVGNLHADIIVSIIMRFIDMTVSNNDPTLRKLCIDLYSIRYGCDAQMSERLLATLLASITPRLVSQEQRVGILPLKSFGISSLREDLCNLLFDIYSSALGHAKQGQYLPRDVVLSVLEAGINDPALQDAAFGLMRSLCSNGRNAVLPLIPRIVLMLISKLDTPSSALFETLAHICRLYGSGSTLFRHLYVVFSAMKHPLDEQHYGPSAARLLSAVVETSAFLVKSEVLLSVQRKICEEVIRNPHSSLYREVLVSFLSCTHELVPPPVHIARTVLGRCTDSEQLQTVVALCDVITRPRMQNLARHEVARRSAVRGGQPVDVYEEELEQQVSAVPMNSCLKESIDFVQEVNEAAKEIHEEHKGSMNGMHSETGGRSTVEAQEEAMACTEMHSEKPRGDAALVSRNAPSVQEESRSPPKVAATDTKMESRSSDTMEPVAKKAKLVKKKETKPVEKTVLADGEASVEEILSTFCPE